MKSKIDFDRVSTLMGIIEKQTSVVPKMTHLSACALRELAEIDAMAQEESRAIAESEQAKTGSTPGQPTDGSHKAPVVHPEQVRQQPSLHPNTPPIERKV